MERLVGGCFGLPDRVGRGGLSSTSAGGGPKMICLAPILMNTRSLLVCAAVFSLHAIATAGGDGWTHDFEAAKKQAAESGKDLLVDFTGSDWCGWCIKLNDEVFKQDEFKQGLKDTFTLVEIDFPEDESKLSEETRKANNALGEKYAVQGYPTIYLCDAQGLPYAATGYEKGGAENYVRHLNELRAKKSKRDEAFAKAGQAEGVEKAKLYIAGLEGLGLEDEVIGNLYGDVIGKIKQADPGDETGFVKKSGAKQRIAEFQEKLQELAQTGEFDGAIALVDKTIADGGFEPDVVFNLKMTRVMIFAEQGKFDQAVDAVDAIKKENPDHPMMSQIDEFRAMLEKEKSGGSAEGETADDSSAKEEAKDGTKEEAGDKAKDEAKD
ncbi:MAG: thioredoxin family protein [Verrucomicrobia bacterium]|nr:thioredoxin family protein [Verrucomicrobiota bacterium]